MRRFPHTIVQELTRAARPWMAEGQGRGIVEPFYQRRRWLPDTAQPGPGADVAGLAQGAGPDGVMRWWVDAGSFTDMVHGAMTDRAADHVHVCALSRLLRVRLHQIQAFVPNEAPMEPVILAASETAPWADLLLGNDDVHWLAIVEPDRW